MATKPLSSSDLSNLPNDALIRLPDVLRIYPVSRALWWQGIKDGVYPKPVHLSERCRAWRLGDVLALTRKEYKA